MRYTVLLIIILLCFSTKEAKAQIRNYGAAWDLGYQYNTRSLGYMGASLGLVTKEMIILNLGGGGYIGKFKGEFKLIPAAYVECSTFFINTKVAASKYFINPSLGINVLNAAKLNLGYSFPLSQINGIKMSGFTIGITLSLGTNGYYIDISN